MLTKKRRSPPRGDDTRLPASRCAGHLLCARLPPGRAGAESERERTVERAVADVVMVFTPEGGGGGSPTNVGLEGGGQMGGRGPGCLVGWLLRRLPRFAALTSAQTRPLCGEQVSLAVVICVEARALPLIGSPAGCCASRPKRGSPWRADRATLTGRKGRARGACSLPPLCARWPTSSLSFAQQPMSYKSATRVQQNFVTALDYSCQKVKSLAKSKASLGSFHIKELAHRIAVNPEEPGTPNCS